jgi:phage gp29-like protein
LTARSAQLTVDSTQFRSRFWGSISDKVREKFIWGTQFAAHISTQIPMNLYELNKKNIDIRLTPQFP